MLIRNTASRWGAVAKALHWLIAALIVVQLPLGLYATALPPDLEKLALLARHKSIGLTILALAAIRLAWRWGDCTPAMPDNLRLHERLLAHFSHATLYFLILAMPLTGWIMSSARGFPVSWFNLFQVPDLVGKNEPLYHAMIITHETLALLLVAVLALHIAAALRHHFALKDDTLRRMLPFGRTGPAHLGQLAESRRPR
jgi:cytochrome b561